MSRRLLGSTLTVLLATGCATSGGPRVVAPPSTAELPQRAVDEVLETTPSGVLVRWQAPGGEPAGSLRPVRTFRTEAGYCREFDAVIETPGGTARAWRDVACRTTDGQWLRRRQERA